MLCVIIVNVACQMLYHYVKRYKICMVRHVILRSFDKTSIRTIADLIVVGMSKNQQHVKAVAANSRKTSRLAKPVGSVEQEDDVEQ